MSNDESLKETGRCAAASIVEMVAALECDYDRLEELREERDAYENLQTDVPDNVSDAYAWARDNRGAADELAELEKAAGECTSREDAETRIQEDALSVHVRTDWHEVGDVPDTANDQFVILLSTGGPASRIRGELSNGEPRRAWLEVQDWGTPWTEYRGTVSKDDPGKLENQIDQDTLLAYARCFYYEEG